MLKLCRYGLLFLINSIIVLAFCTCKQKEKQHCDENGCIICLYDEISGKDASLVIDSIEYIALETTDSVLIGRIKKIICRNNYFYIFDNVNKSVVVFDNKGKYIYQIKKLGEGPGEYIEPVDMDVDNEGNVYISDNAKCRIIKYKYLSSDFEIFEIGVHFMDFCYLNDSLFALGDVWNENGLYSKLSIYTACNSKINSLLTPEYNNLNEFILMKTNSIYRSNNEIYYYKRFSPYIYKINELGELSASMNIVSKKYASEELLKQLEFNGANDYFNERSYIKNIADIYENNLFYICRLDIAPPLSSFDYLVVSKETNKAFLFDLISNKKMFSCHNIIGVCGNKYMTYMNYDNEIAEKYKDIPSLNDFREDSNPAIILFTLKYK